MLLLLLSCSLGAVTSEAWCRVVSGEIVINTTLLPEYDAYANFTDTMDDHGWYQLHVTGNESSTPSDMMRCAGALEGYLSWHRIDQYFRLIWDMNE
jgi:hypothetical protein